MTALAASSDEELMAALQHGELRALEAIYDRHHRLALALALRIVGSRELAEEVLQEAFLSIWRRSTTYRPELGGVRGWLLSIVRNRAIDRVRGARGRPVLVELDDSIVGYQTPDVAEVVDWELIGERVREALDDLPPEQREAVDLAYFCGLTHVQISDQTGAPLGTIKGRLRLALDKLRRTLADLASEPDATHVDRCIRSRDADGRACAALVANQ